YEAEFAIAGSDHSNFGRRADEAASRSFYREADRNHRSGMAAGWKEPELHRFARGCRQSLEASAGREPGAADHQLQIGPHRVVHMVPGWETRLLERSNHSGCHDPARDQMTRGD